MKNIARKTRSATRPVKSQRVKIIIKMQEDEEMTDTNAVQEERVATPPPEPFVKVEENDVIVKRQLPRLGNEKG